MLDFPSSPTTGQIFTAPNGSTWVWDGVKWASTSAGAAYLPLSGGTLTGPLIQAADPVQPLGSATKQYVDAQNVRYRNRIINGDMAVDARNGGAQVAMPTGNAYIIDRWKLNNPSSVPSKGPCGQFTIGSAPPPGFPFYGLQFATSTAYPTPAASDAIRFLTLIEGCNFLDAQWGTAQAQPIVVEFWANAIVAGTYAFSVNNYAATRSYVATYTLPANAWTKVRISIPGDTGGAWSVAVNAGMLVLGISLCVGPTAQTSTLNAWQNGNFISTASAVNVLAAVNNSLSITGVALMVGAAASNAEPEFRKYSDNLIDCMRYFYKPLGSISGSSYGGAASSANAWVIRSFPVSMRTTPTQAGATFTNTSNNATPSINSLSASAASWLAANAAAGIVQFGIVSDTYDADF